MVLGALGSGPSGPRPSRSVPESQLSPMSKQRGALSCGSNTAVTAAALAETGASDDVSGESS